MHYYYGICSHCQRSTYRWPTENFYRHMDGTVADTKCELEVAVFA